MAVRTIDASRFGEILEQWKKDCLEDNDTQGADIISDVMLQLDDMPTLTPQNEWVSVDERLPEYNPGTGAKSYWVAKKDSAGNWQMKIAQYCDYGYAMTVDAETEITWRDWDFTKIVSVTHWMPLPAPPDRRQQEGGGNA